MVSRFIYSKRVGETMKLKLFLFAIAMCTLINTIDNAKTRAKQIALDRRLDGIYLLMWEQDEKIMDISERW